MRVTSHLCHVVLIDSEPLAHGSFVCGTSHERHVVLDRLRTPGTWIICVRHVISASRRPCLAQSPWHVIYISGHACHTSLFSSTGGAQLHLWAMFGPWGLTYYTQQPQFAKTLPIPQFAKTLPIPRFAKTLPIPQFVKTLPIPVTGFSTPHTKYSTRGPDTSLIFFGSF